MVCNRRFLFTSKEKIPGKGLFIDLSNEHKFTYVPRRVCSRKGVFDERWGFNFFSRENSWDQRVNDHRFWRSKHDLIYYRQRIPWLMPDVIPFFKAYSIFPSKVNSTSCVIQSPDQDLAERRSASGNQQNLNKNKFLQSKNRARPMAARLNSCLKFQRLLLKMYLE